MEFKGTKGEWYANTSEPIEIRSGQTSIAFVTITDHYNKDIQAHANAKLIAAAPETTKCLKKSTSVLEAILELFGDNMASTTKFGVVSQIKANKKAIEKALK